MAICSFDRLLTSVSAASAAGASAFACARASFLASCSGVRTYGFFDPVTGLTPLGIAEPGGGVGAEEGGPELRGVWEADVAVEDMGDAEGEILCRRGRGRMGVRTRRRRWTRRADL